MEPIYDSAKKLNIKLLNYFNEDQIYRIDHYLGKETVQNMLVTRFSNGIFEPLWNHNYIERVEITSAESLVLKAGEDITIIRVHCATCFKII